MVDISPRSLTQILKVIMPVLSFSSQYGKLWFLFIHPPFTAKSLIAKDQQFSGKRVLT